MTTTLAAQTDFSSQLPPKRFALTGRSVRLDPATNAYRSDIADVALAGQVIASHYAQALVRIVLAPTHLNSAASPDAGSVAMLAPGDLFAVLDCGRGLAWGFALEGHRVGYVDEYALG